MTVPHIENHNISRERVKNSVECGTVAKKVGDNLTRTVPPFICIII